VVLPQQSRRIETLLALDQAGQNVILIGVTFALLDLIENAGFNCNIPSSSWKRKGKGRRKEMIREELHEQLCAGFGVSAIHSEYGMTELLASVFFRNGVFECPSWMQILVRDTEDALTYIPDGKQAEST
jgi:hypothetical protein